jgi:hypothetical protein
VVCNIPNIRFWSGGGAGGTAIEVIPFPTATNVPVTIGAGGGNPVGASSVGNPGGTSSFGAYCSATGERRSSTICCPMASAAGNGGVGSGGTLNLSGGDGVNAVLFKQRILLEWVEAVILLLVVEVDQAP